MNSQNKPNLFIIGAPKAGTTAIVKELGNHSEIFLPKEKEPRFFDANVFYDDPELYPIKDIDSYLNLFDSEESTTAMYRVDGSVFIMYSQEAIERILALSPEAKFVLVLRDPVDAAKSMFVQRLKYPSGPMREVANDFPACWERLKQRKHGSGYPKNCKNTFLFRYDLLYAYENYLPMLRSTIPDKQLLVLKYEDLKKNPVLFYNNIYDYLSLSFSGRVANEKVNLSIPREKSFVHSLIEFIAKLTRPIREKLGLTGIVSVNKLSSVRELDLDSLQLDSIDSEVMEEFRSTYSFLSEQGIYEVKKT